MKKRKVMALLVLIALALSLPSCATEDFVPPTSYWCSTFRNLIMRSESGTFEGDVASLQLSSQNIRTKLEELETLEEGSKVEEFLLSVLEIADWLAIKDVESFFDLPRMEQQAFLDAWYILGNANYAASEEEYIEILNDYAASWLDIYAGPMAGKTIPSVTSVSPNE